MTTAQIIISAIQIMLASSSFTLAAVVARKTAHEKHKEPFSVTDLQSVAESNWVTPVIRESARQELLRRCVSLGIRAEISGLGEFEEDVIEKLRIHHSGLVKARKDEKFHSFVANDANVGKMYISFPWPEILCLVSFGIMYWTGQVLFSSINEMDSVIGMLYAYGMLFSFPAFLIFFWVSLRRCKLTYQYISAVMKLTGKEYKKEAISITRLRYSLGKLIASHSKIEQAL